MNQQDINNLLQIKMENVNKISVNGSESPKPFAMRALGLVPKYWNMCSDGTKNNFAILAQTIVVMSVILGSIMAISFANMFLGSFWYGIVLMPFTISFYFFLDRLVAIGKNSGWQTTLRVIIAMLIVAITCIPLDEMLFGKDTKAKYQAELELVKDKSLVIIDSLNSIRNLNIIEHQKQVNALNDTISKSRSVATRELDVLFKNGIRGDGPNYKEKRKSFEEEEKQRQVQLVELKKQFEAEDSSNLIRINKEIAKAENSANTVSNGLAANVQRLYSFIFSEASSTIVCILIWLFMIMLELMVVLVKYKHPTAEYYLYQQIEADSNVETNQEQARISKNHVIDIATAKSDVEKKESIRNIENDAKTKEMQDNISLEYKLALELSNGLNQLNSILKELLSAHPDLKKDLEKTKGETNTRIFEKIEELIN